MTFAPALTRFHARTVLLFGSSAVAASLVRRLVRAGARVRWFSRDVDVAEELWLSGEPSQIEIAFREPRAIDFEEAAAVIATIGEPLVFRLSEQARAAGCAVAVVGRPELSTFNLDEARDADRENHALRKPRPRKPRPNATSWHPTAWLSVHVARARLFLSALVFSFVERSDLIRDEAPHEGHHGRNDTRS